MELRAHSPFCGPLAPARAGRVGRGACVVAWQRGSRNEGVLRDPLDPEIQFPGDEVFPWVKDTVVGAKRLESLPFLGIGSLRRVQFAQKVRERGGFLIALDCLEDRT